MGFARAFPFFFIGVTFTFKQESNSSRELYIEAVDVFLNRQKVGILMEEDEWLRSSRIRMYQQEPLGSFEVASFPKFQLRTSEGEPEESRKDNFGTQPTTGENFGKRVFVTEKEMSTKKGASTMLLRTETDDKISLRVVIWLLSRNHDG